MSLSKLRSSSTMQIATSVNYPRRLPPGFIFAPTDEQLVCYYLCNRVMNISFEDPTNRFQEIELYNFSPEQLKEKYGKQDECEMYIFVKKIPKHQSGNYLQRETISNGYWLNRGQTNIKSEDQVVGHRTNLVYCIGKGKEKTRTKWLMQEYRLLPDDHMMLDEWMLCKVYESKRPMKIENQAVPSEQECRRPYLDPVTDQQSTAISSIWQSAPDDFIPHHDCFSDLDAFISSPDFSPPDSSHGLAV